MQCVINENIKMLKIFYFPCNYGNQSGWGNQVWKKPILRHFWTTTAISLAYIEIYTVDEKF